MVSVICSLAFASCSDFAGKPVTHPTANYKNAVVGGLQAGPNVTIGQTTYNPATKSFEKPWPFGPVFNPQ